MLYGESLTGAKATRMVRDGRFKLIWYPAGNRLQLFDLADDPSRAARPRGGSEGTAPVREQAGVGS